MKKSPIMRIVYTAVFIALLVALQFSVGQLGIVLLTGSVVNFVLIASVLLFDDLICGAVVAVLSPVIAYFTGVAPLASPLMMPVVVLGNIVLVILFYLLFKIKLPKVKGIPALNWFISIIVASAVKCGALYLAMVKLLVPYLFANGDIIEKQVNMISASFGISQLFTALIGGAIAFAVVPTLRYALKIKD
jgi:hypothetical protein